MRWVSGASVSGTLVDLFQLRLVIRQRDGRSDRVRSVILEAITGLGRPREAGGGGVEGGFMRVQSPKTGLWTMSSQ